MKRRRRGWPDGREQASMAEIYVYDLDEIGLEELSGEPQQETAGDRKAQAPTLEQLEEELRKTRHKSRYRKVLRSTSFSLLVVAAAAVLTAVLFLPVLRIDGTSMTQTLQDGDIVVAVSGTKFRIGDVVAFYYNNSILVKRVIATAGDWVDIDGGPQSYQHRQPKYLSGLYQRGGCRREDHVPDMAGAGDGTDKLTVLQIQGRRQHNGIFEKTGCKNLGGAEEI